MTQAANCDATTGRCVGVPIDVANPGDKVVVTLYGTGIRGLPSLDYIAATVHGIPVEVQYAGAQPQFPGLDQINLALPASLAGLGNATVSVTVSGYTANGVSIAVQ